MNYLFMFENIKLVMSLSCVLSPRASEDMKTKKNRWQDPGYKTASDNI